MLSVFYSPNLKLSFQAQPVPEPELLQRQRTAAGDKDTAAAAAAATPTVAAAAAQREASLQGLGRTQEVKLRGTGQFPVKFKRTFGNIFKFILFLA